MPEWNFDKIMHGGDYNPDQWRHIPGTLDEDMRLMRLSKTDLLSVGIFAWSALEPREGEFDFGWLDDVLDRIHKNGGKVFLATPSGARPVWMSKKYPEVLRVREDGLRNTHGGRHNHCLTSSVYREKVGIINQKLAERYHDHPALAGWHISNEYGGSCYCDLCQEKFRDFLKRRYGTIDALNEAWWTDFWSHRYTDFSQIDAPTRHGDMSIDGCQLDWRRFVTEQTVDFMRAEIDPIRRFSPDIPVTANFMLFYEALDYSRFADDVDVVSWDSYPLWRSSENSRYDFDVAQDIGFWHDVMRGIKKKPFLLMESTPSMTNWQEICRPKRPGMHMLSSLHAVAHGADSVQYFQWRKGRGGAEKHHGAVVDHFGGENTRVFKDVAAVGEALDRLKNVAGGATVAEAAIIFDWENRWAVKTANGPRRDKQYESICVEHYAALRKLGIDIDIIGEEADFSGYKLLVLPMVYMFKEGFAERVREFVKAGGTVLATFHTGVVDENSLCFTQENPAGLADVFGIWAEEIDALYDDEKNAINIGGKSYECGFLCQIIHSKGSKAIGVYEKDFYAGYPALTENAYGGGKAYYLAARADSACLLDIYQKIAGERGIERIAGGQDGLPCGVEASLRVKDGIKTLFLMNFSSEARSVGLPAGEYRDLLSGSTVNGSAELPPWGVFALQNR